MHIRPRTNPARCYYYLALTEIMPRGSFRARIITQEIPASCAHTTTSLAIKGHILSSAAVQEVWHHLSHILLSHSHGPCYLPVFDESSLRTSL